jgi:hypothetical protein
MSVNVYESTQRRTSLDAFIIIPVITSDIVLETSILHKVSMYKLNLSGQPPLSLRELNRLICNDVINVMVYVEVT